MDLPSRILVVDDEPQIQLLLEEFLTSLGHTVRVAGDGEQALQLLQREAFDAVLADLKMAKLGGMELLRIIKLSHPTLPVIMITGYPSVEVAVDAMKEGAVDFITKPLRLDTLRLALARITRKSLSRQLISTPPPPRQFRVHCHYLRFLARLRNFPFCMRLAKPFKPLQIRKRFSSA
jgi:DNA-binding NtrC family response regulator